MKQPCLAPQVWGEPSQIAVQSPPELGDLGGKIPVLVELRYWQGSIAQLILNSFTRHGLALKEEQLETVLPPLLILFDGVNELPSEEARSQLAAFRRNHPKVPMIFTTRDLSLGGDLGIEKKLEMQPLTEEQMQAFIRAYVPEQAEAMLRQLRDRLREFGQTPLLLWMLCEVFQQTPNNQLPSNLAGVFQAFTAMYEISSVRKHEVALLKGDVKPLSDRRLWKKALKALASVMMQGETAVDFRVVIHRDEAERELSKIFLTEQFPVRDILDDLLKYHLLQNRSLDQIEFCHQLIQEYYAAEYLLQLLPDLSDEQLKRDYLNYLKWTEPIALMLALENKEAQALRVVKLAMHDVDLMLGARLAGKVKQALLSRTVNIIAKQQVCKTLRIRLLGKTRSEAAVQLLIDLLKDESSSVRSHVVYALGQIGGEAAISGLIEALKDDEYSVRSSVIDALRQIGGESILPVLIKALEDQKLWGQAITLLTEAELGEKLGLGDNFKILSAAIEHLDSDIRWGAAIALIQMDSIKSAPILCKAIKNPNPDVQFSAAVALGMMGFEIAVPILQREIEFIDSSDTQRMVIYALAKIDSERSVSAIQELFQNSNPDIVNLVVNTLLSIDIEEISPTLRRLYARLQDARCRFEASIYQLLNTEETSNRILKATQNISSEVVKSAAFFLNKIGNPKMFSTLWQQQRRLFQKDIAETITAIQNRCKFYNYDIWQEAIQNEQLEIKNGEQGASVGKTTNIFNIKTLNAPNAALNLGGTIHGDQTGTQRHPPKS
jgi:HEAT repeat protein